MNIPDEVQHAALDEFDRVIEQGSIGPAVTATWHVVAEWARKEALREAADTFDARLADGTGNGRAYNSYTVARMLRALADGDAS